MPRPLNHHLFMSTKKTPAEELPPLHIVSLTAENVKRLKAVHITPAGESLVIVGGRNAQGKTSVLDSIAMALGGTKGMPAKPIREGATAASIVLDLGDIKVERKFSASGPSLIVRGADGSRLQSPQAVLDALTSRVSFDPLAFMHMDTREQADTIRKLAGLDFTEKEAERAKLYNERTGANRDVTTQQMRVSGMPSHDDAPEAAIDTAALMQRLDKATRENNENNAKRESLEQKAKTLGRANQAVAELEAKLAEAKKNAALEKGEFTKMEHDCKALVDVVLTGTKAELEQAGEKNRKFEQNAAKLEETKKLKDLVARASELTASIAKIDAEKLKAIREAKYPVDGLTFDDAGVLYKNMPLAQASNAEQLRVSVGVGIAMNPPLKVLLVRDGSLLDEENLALLAKLAKDNDAQVWVERVGKGAECTVIIEDGEVEEAAK